MTPQEMLNLPIEAEYSDIGATTIRGYLQALLLTLWHEQDLFSSKRPFGNSGWDVQLVRPLVAAGLVSGGFDADGYLDYLDDDLATALIDQCIEAL